jgi:hypothetical protein
MFTFRDLGVLDIQSMRDVVSRNPTDWDNEFSVLRKRLYREHQHVDVIPLQWSAESLSASPDEAAPKTRYFAKYYDETLFSSLTDILTTAYGSGYFVRLLLLRLPPKSTIPTHADDGENLVLNRRVHVPILTNERVFFSVGAETRCPNEGDVFEIDNTNLHSVENLSDAARVHLVADWHVEKVQARSVFSGAHP